MVLYSFFRKIGWTAVTMVVSNNYFIHKNFVVFVITILTVKFISEGSSDAK